MMQKKLPLIVFFTVLLLAVGAFHYQGTKSTVTATEGSSMTEVQTQKENAEQKKSIDDKGEVTASETDETSTLESENSEAPVEDMADSSSADTVSEVPTQTNDNTSANEPESFEKVVIKFGDTEYVDITDMEKFKEMGAFAQKHGARLFAVENTDCFAIIKDNDPILMFSVGSVSAGIEDITVLKDYFVFNNFSQGTGIAGNIDIAAETGAKVHVEFPDLAGYSIIKKDNTILISWGSE
ncbi:hypothetical protein ACOJQI_20490 [Bacillus salacetis]|uniref:hypothetical protein n=1 Tax=Bacillus salacetis TaxID=2315464 RepID=UPI003B9EC81A